MLTSLGQVLQRIYDVPTVKPVSTRDRHPYFCCLWHAKEHLPNVSVSPQQPAQMCAEALPYFDQEVLQLLLPTVAVDLSTSSHRFRIFCFSRLLAHVA